MSGLFDSLPKFPPALPDDELRLLAALPDWDTVTEISHEDEAVARREDTHENPRMSRRKTKIRKGPAPFDVLIFDAKLTAIQARAALDSLKKRKFAVLSARDQIGMHESINRKIKIIIDLMMIGQNIEKRREKLAALLLNKMENEDDEAYSQSPRCRRNIAQYLLGPMLGRKQSRKTRPRFRSDRLQ